MATLPGKPVHPVFYNLRRDVAELRARGLRIADADNPRIEPTEYARRALSLLAAEQLQVARIERRTRHTSRRISEWLGEPFTRVRMRAPFTAINGHEDMSMYLRWAVNSFYNLRSTIEGRRMDPPKFGLSLVQPTFRYFGSQIYAIEDLGGKREELGLLFALKIEQHLNDKLRLSVEPTLDHVAHPGHHREFLDDREIHNRILGRSGIAELSGESLRFGLFAEAIAARTYGSEDEIRKAMAVASAFLFVHLRRLNEPVGTNEDRRRQNAGLLTKMTHAFARRLPDTAYEALGELIVEAPELLPDGVKRAYSHKPPDDNVRWAGPSAYLDIAHPEQMQFVVPNPEATSTFDEWMVVHAEVEELNGKLQVAILPFDPEITSEDSVRGRVNYRLTRNAWDFVGNVDESRIPIIPTRRLERPLILPMTALVGEAGVGRFRSHVPDEGIDQTLLLA